MADNYIQRLERLQRYGRFRQQLVPRTFKDRANPLETLSREEIRERYRFFSETIIMIVGLIFPALDTMTRRSLPLPLLPLLVSLQFFATGAHYLLISEIHGISRPSVGRAVDRVTRALCGLIGTHIYMSRDDAQTRAKKRQFFSIAEFPNVLGCVDGTQIRIRAPSVNEADFVNRKGFHSINVQMVCDAQFIILDVIAKWPGSVHDSRIFKESRLCTDLENGVFDGVLLGDSGYACKKYLLTPYLNPQTQAQNRFNNSLCKTRVLIEQTFGVIKRRFAILSYGIRTFPGKACQMTMACAILHNIGIRQGDIFGKFVVEADNHPHEAPNQPIDVAGNAYRDYVCTTFF